MGRDRTVDVRIRRSPLQSPIGTGARHGGQYFRATERSNGTCQGRYTPRNAAHPTVHSSAPSHDSALRPADRCPHPRDARKRSGLTQQQLAGDRYTKAYVSALETGIARPSMVALQLPRRAPLAAAQPLPRRAEPDLEPPCGRHDARGRRLAGAPPTATRIAPRRRRSTTTGAPRSCAAAPRRSLAWTTGKDTVTAAAEAARLFASLGRVSDEALARYWLAYGLYLSDQEADAQSLLTSLLERVRAGLKVEPDFEMRLLMALAAVASRSGDYARSLTLPRDGTRPGRRPRRPTARHVPLQPGDQLPGDRRPRGRDPDRHPGTGPAALGRRGLRIGARSRTPLRWPTWPAATSERAAELADEARAAFAGGRRRPVPVRRPGHRCPGRPGPGAHRRRGHDRAIARSRWPQRPATAAWS